MLIKKFAVVLSGCGVYDGSEIHEAVCTLLAIEKAGACYECFAPNVNQYHVINHLTGQVVNQTRNVLEEAARIARGTIKELSRFDPTHFDALIFPGGFGAAKNLSTFAFDGADCLILPEVENAIRNAYNSRIPIGALCIAPTLLAKVLGKGNLTIGNDLDTAAAIEIMGSMHTSTLSGQIISDRENKIVSAPCYMLNTKISTIASEAEKVIAELLSMM